MIPDPQGGEAVKVTRGMSLKELKDRFGGLSFVYLVERFGVWQKDKCRACDNFASNEVNDYTCQSETINCIGPDFMAMVACLFAEQLPQSANWQPQCFTEDIISAYRICGGRSPAFSTVAQWDPVRKQVAFFIVPGLNFGLRSAVTQFHRVPVLCTALARRCLMIPCGHYFDDYACVEPKGCGKSA